MHVGLSTRKGCRDAFTITNLGQVTVSAESGYWMCGMFIDCMGMLNLQHEKKDGMMQVSSEPICMTIKNNISKTYRSFARAVAKHRLIKRSIFTAAWQHENMAGMQDVTRLCGGNSRLPLVCSTDPSCLAGPLQKHSPPRTADKLSVVNGAAEANLCPFLHKENNLMSLDFSPHTAVTHNSLKYSSLYE